LSLGSRTFDEIVQRVAECEWAIHVPVEIEPDPEKFAGDGYHPSESGYADFGEAIRTYLEPVGTSSESTYDGTNVAPVRGWPKVARLIVAKSYLLHRCWSIGITLLLSVNATRQEPSTARCHCEPIGFTSLREVGLRHCKPIGFTSLREMGLRHCKPTGFTSLREVGLRHCEPEGRGNLPTLARYNRFNPHPKSTSMQGPSDQAGAQQPGGDCHTRFAGSQ